MSRPTIQRKSIDTSSIQSSINEENIPYMPLTDQNMNYSKDESSNDASSDDSSIHIGKLQQSSSVSSLESEASSIVSRHEQHTTFMYASPLSAKHTNDYSSSNSEAMKSSRESEDTFGLSDDDDDDDHTYDREKEISRYFSSPSYDDDQMTWIYKRYSLPVPYAIASGTSSTTEVSTKQPTTIKDPLPTIPRQQVIVNSVNVQHTYTSPLSFVQPQYRHHLSPPPHVKLFNQDMADRRSFTKVVCEEPPQLATKIPDMSMRHSLGTFNEINLSDDTNLEANQGNTSKQCKSSRLPIPLILWCAGWLLPLLWVAGAFWIRSECSRHRFWGTACFMSFNLFMVILIGLFIFL
jgi:hypothetical protein